MFRFVKSLRPTFPGHDLIFLSKFNSQVMWNLLFEPLIWNFKSDWKFLIWFFFLWLLISYQTSKLRPKINVWKKNQISDRKIKSCWNDLIWNLLLDLTWFIFAVFDVKSFWLLIFMWQGKRALEKSIFFKIVIMKISNLNSSMNYWCSEDFFELLHDSLAQKLTNPKFSPMIFLFLPSVSLATSWGQTNSLRNLTRVLNEA